VEDCRFAAGAKDPVPIIVQQTAESCNLNITVQKQFQTVTSPSFLPNPAPSIRRSCKLVFSSLRSDSGNLLTKC
jgi:hypothetical protein